MTIAGWLERYYQICCYGLAIVMFWFCLVSHANSTPVQDRKSSEQTKPHIVASYAEAGLNSASKHEKMRVYQYRQADGVMAFSDKAPSKGNYQVHLYDCFACRPDSEINWKSIKLYTTSHRTIIARAANKHQLEPALIRAVIHAESAFNVQAVSRTGAMGLMQLMPETANELGVTNAFKPEQNILGGSKYLAKMLTRFNGDIALACAAYNAGPSTVTQYRGIPPYPETQAYVERVQILLKRYRQAEQT